MTASPAPTGQRLAVFQSLWAMEGLPFGIDPTSREQAWSLAERVSRIAGAGFDGLAVDLGAREAPTPAELLPLLAEHGLRRQVFAFVNDAHPLAEALEYAQALGAELVVLCAQVFPSSIEAAVDLLYAWGDEARAAGLPLQLETHRFTMTDDLSTTVELLDALPALPLAVDLSHHVVGHELPDGADERVDRLVARVLERGSSFQGRIATRGQVQVSPRFPQHQQAVERFRGWWRTGFAAWRARSAPDAELTFCCELGTTPYAITGPDGREISDRWADALLLREWALDLFAAAGPG